MAEPVKDDLRPRPGDETGLRRLGVNLTSDPSFFMRDLCQT